jgi:hypothetical protein
MEQFLWRISHITWIVTVPEDAVQYFKEKIKTNKLNGRFCIKKSSPITFTNEMNSNKMKWIQKPDVNEEAVLWQYI